VHIVTLHLHQEAIHLLFRPMSPILIIWLLQVEEVVVRGMAAAVAPGV
jgi:hypothetical protein